MQMPKTTLLSPSLYGGRFTREQFWKYYFAGFIALVLLGFVSGEVYPFGVTALYTVFYCVPVDVKRAHDLGFSAKWPIVANSIFFAIETVQEYGLVCHSELDEIIYWVIAVPYLIWLGFSDSQKGTNEFGQSIKYPDVETLLVVSTE